ncbi:MAG TPA: hypothetical protein VGJ87_04185 [Roseiflexaceae bacterium]
MVFCGMVAWCAAASPGLCFGQAAGHDMRMQPHAAASRSVVDSTKEEADKRFSEFNHRFAGTFILLLGLLALLEPALAERAPSVRYLWAVFFFIPGLYLLFFSDPESWPLGSQTLSYVMTRNREVLQHKTFSLLLLGLAVVEFLRVQRRLSGVWAAALFPVLAGAGALLLLLHSPQAHAASAHEAMRKIEHQHLEFAAAGLGAILAKAVAELGNFHPRWMRRIFAGLLSLLGVLLLLYTE